MKKSIQKDIYGAYVHASSPSNIQNTTSSNMTCGFFKTIYIFENIRKLQWEKKILLPNRLKKNNIDLHYQSITHTKSNHNYKEK